jgi:hypothetical protein
MRKHFTRPQKLTILGGILWLVLILVILQLWLLTATMNSYLGGDDGVPVPALIFSVFCLALNLGLLRFLYALDRTPLVADEQGTLHIQTYPEETRHI